MLASRTTLFEGGGDDVAKPNDITMSCVPSYAKPRWTSKVNSFLFEISFPTLWNGMLLEHPPICIARFDTIDTKPMGGAEEAQELISSKAYAWMRRRKRHGQAEEEGGGDRPAGLPAGPGWPPGRPPIRRSRPPGRPRPAPRPDHQQTPPASRPAQAGSQAGPPPDAAGLQAGPGRPPGRTPTVLY